MPDVRAYVDVDAPAERVWDRVTDWPRQGEWMLGTTVAVADGDGRTPGSVLSATTEVGPLAFVDEMTIVEWSPHHRCTVEHTGAVVRGVGTFEVLARADGRTRVVWTEQLAVPFGVLGTVGWLAAGPISHLGLQVSLTRFARSFEAA